MKQYIVQFSESSAYFRAELGINAKPNTDYIATSHDEKHFAVQIPDENPDTDKPTPRYPARADEFSKQIETSY